MRILTLLSSAVLLACSTPSAPLEAQRGNPHLHRAAAGPVAIAPLSGQLADGSGTFSGSLSLTHVSRSADSLFADGQVTGTITQATGTTQVDQPVSHIAFTVDPQSRSCNHLQFFFGTMTLAGHEVPFPRAYTNLGGDGQLTKLFCQLDAATTDAQRDKYIAQINARLAG